MTADFNTETEPDALQPSAPYDEAEGVQQPHPPELDEAIRQMQATQQDILHRLDGEEEQPEGGLEYGIPDYSDEELGAYAEESGLLDQGIEDQGAGLDDVINQRVQDAVLPIAGRMEMDRRTAALYGLAERYPELQDERSIDEVSGEVERLGAAYGLAPEVASTDPALVELVLQARAGRQAAANEVPAEAGVGGGATLETGAGPSPPAEPELDAATKSYLQAIAGPDKPNAFTR